MTEEQRLLVEKAHTAKDAAALLLDNGFYDGAISRAYYGMFYLAKAALLSKGVETSSHHETNGSFGREFAKTSLLPRKLHAFLLEAQGERSDADYLLQSSFEREDAEAQIENLSVFLSEVEAYLAEQPSDT